ncbi:hypothetical protein [Nocardia niigatensis]
MARSDRPTTDGPVRAEIQFFMDKVFQVSLAYIVALGTLLAFANSAMVVTYAGLAKMPPAALVANILLLLNIVYLTLAVACLFAVLKRGLFALTNQAQVSETWHRWEVFVRRENDWPIAKYFPSLAWNVDNYYAMPLNGLIVIMSVLAGVVCFTSHHLTAILTAATLWTLHSIPGWMSWQLRNLNIVCRQAATRIHQTNCPCLECIGPTGADRA